MLQCPESVCRTSEQPEHLIGLNQDVLGIQKTWVPVFRDPCRKDLITSDYATFSFELGNQAAGCRNSGLQRPEGPPKDVIVGPAVDPNPRPGTTSHGLVEPSPAQFLDSQQRQTQAPAGRKQEAF